MMNINTSTNEFEPVVRTEVSAVPIELLPSTRTLENTPSTIVVETEPSETDRNVEAGAQTENIEQTEIPNNEQKISVGPKIALREVPNDVRLQIMFDKLEGKDIPSIAA